MSRLLFVLFALALPSTSLATHFNHVDWDELLKQHVIPLPGGHATQVDYAAIAAKRDQLKQYLTATSTISQARFDRWSTAEQLAFLINAYNAWTIELILSRYPNLQSIKDLGSFFQSPWKKSFIPLLDENRSLDDIEHELIRGSGRYDDPRIHFAVNCASIGCPALRPEAFDDEQLDAQLEDSAQRFLSDRTRNRLTGDTLEVSSIFKWYKEDFEHGWRGANTLGAFLALYSESLGLDAATTARLKSGALKIHYLSYDWRLNGKP